jgi:hypothetical protein
LLSAVIAYLPILWEKFFTKDGYDPSPGDGWMILPMLAYSLCLIVAGLVLGLSSGKYR